jgi:hypothetical protein
MIETLAAGANQLASLVIANEKVRWDRFNALATPVMADLRKIHGDYLTLFQDVVRELRQPTFELESTLVKFATARSKLHPDRMALRNSIEATHASPKADPFRPFMEAALDWLLSFSYQQGETSISSFFYSVLEQATTGQRLNQLNASSVREDLALQADANIAKLEEVWNNLSRNYEQLKVRLVP